MILNVRNKFLTLGGSSEVFDEEKNPHYKVKGNIFTFTKKKKIYDMEGNLRFVIRNKYFNFFVHRAYIYDANGEKLCSVRDKWMNFNGEYFVEGYKDEIKIEGHFFKFDSKILRNGEVIGNIHRKMFALTSFFEITASEQDMPFLVALIIAIDNIQDNRSNRNN